MKVLTVANIVERKRIDLCALACIELDKQKDGGQVEWTVIGRGDKEDEIKSLAPQSMKFIPKVDSLRDHFRASDVFVLPSYDEGFGMVYIEAIMCGCPVVCRKNDGGEEIVNTTGGGVAIEISDSDQQAVENIVAAVNRIVSNRSDYANERTQELARQMVNPVTIKKAWHDLVGGLNLS